MRRRRSSKTYDERNVRFLAARRNFHSRVSRSFCCVTEPRFKDEEAVRMVLHTCDKMAAGGIHDQIGGGFARYSRGCKMAGAAFRKDAPPTNAQLVNLYLNAYLVSGDARHAATARDILQYVLRDMTHPDGGFYSAEDADSEGKEGKFYCWTRTELSHLLTPEEFNVTVKYFGVTEQGNFIDHSDPNPLPNQNVLSIVGSELAKGDEKLLASAKAKMFAARAKRVRPHLDDKVLASWNGLMLGAMARAYAVPGSNDGQCPGGGGKNPVVPRCAHRASFGMKTTKTLYHVRWRDGQARHSVPLQEAYAFELAGVLDLYEATLEPKHLEFAVALAEGM